MHRICKEKVTRPSAQPRLQKRTDAKRRLSFFGAANEARTRYLHLGKVALYQMSYIRIMVPSDGIEPSTRGFSVLCSTD